MTVQKRVRFDSLKIGDRFASGHTSKSRLYQKTGDLQAADISEGVLPDGSFLIDPFYVNKLVIPMNDEILHVIIEKVTRSDMWGG